MISSDEMALPYNSHGIDAGLESLDSSIGPPERERHEFST